MIRFARNLYGETFITVPISLKDSLYFLDFKIKAGSLEEAREQGLDIRSFLGRRCDCGKEAEDQIPILEKGTFCGIRKKTKNGEEEDQSYFVDMEAKDVCQIINKMIKERNDILFDEISESIAALYNSEYGLCEECFEEEYVRNQND